MYALLPVLPIDHLPRKSLLSLLMFKASARLVQEVARAVTCPEKQDIAWRQEHTHVCTPQAILKLWSAKSAQYDANGIGECRRFNNLWHKTIKS